ncbi:type II toxin-antitoxin system death-on-curing family toxin [Stenotrophomonas maltophilia]|nr:type II toxin-antitoxin system death-on-curing family toxin [Stenotrophomonas maltophilia]
MPDPVYLDLEAILALYDDMRHDFAVGVASIDPFKIEGALSRVESNFVYGNPPPGIPQLGALLGYSIAKAHAFGDGNKRTAFAAMDLFLQQNGWVNGADGIETAKKIEQVVANEISEAEFIDWIAMHCVDEYELFEEDHQFEEDVE